MNLEAIARYLQQPSLLTLDDAEKLQSMSEKHPYAAVFSLLYLTALANGKSIDLDRALQQHAYRLNDRTKLYHLVHAQTDTPENTAEELVVQTATPESEPAVIVQTTEQEPESAPTAVPEIVATEELPAIPFEAVTDAFTLEQQLVLDEGMPQTTPAIAESSVPDPKGENEEEVPAVAVPIVNPSEKRSFTAWLKSSQPEVKQAPQTNATITDSKQNATELIDRFIAEEPTISRPKNEFFSPPKKAKESLDEHAIPVSETLAKIYASQGNYPKAIHVYHQLMLSFPEKKLLFAVRIEELKKKITT